MRASCQHGRRRIEDRIVVEVFAKTTKQDLEHVFRVKHTLFRIEGSSIDNVLDRMLLKYSHSSCPMAYPDLVCLLEVVI